MTTSNDPTEVKTSSGTPLPVLSQPQGELLTVNIDNIPLLKDAIVEGAHFQPLCLDMENNLWVVLANFDPGVVLPVHYHTGPAQVYTLQGCWKYKEYPDQPQTAGSYLYEPGGSVHTFYTPEENTEQTIFLVIVSGANVNFTEDGKFHSILDALHLTQLADQAAKKQGLSDLPYIRGGEMHLTGKRR
jgi:quercetin dioxygenase-like cupin family protein